jgi:hypothetical protein
MIEETSGDRSHEAGPESDKPIALGGPVAPGEEPHATPEPEPAPEPEPETPRPVDPQPAPAPHRAPEPVAQRRSPLMPLLGLLGFVVLAVAIGYLWVRPVPVPPTPAMPPDESAAVTALQNDMATLKTRLAALDKRETSDVDALHTAIAALPAPAPAGQQSAPAAQSGTPAQSSSSAQSGTPAQSSSSAQSGTPAQNTTPAQTTAPPASVLAQAAADAALTTSVATLGDRLDHLQSAEAAQAKQTQSLPSAADVSKLASRVDDVGQRESKDDTAIRQDLSLVQQQLATLSGQAQTLTKSSAALPKLSAQADRLTQIVRAQDALRAGLPLGTIANAPPALTRFANAAPPTEAALRLSFADAARAAVKAGEPTPDQGHFWHRVWLRAQTLVMVRQGDRVVLGDPTSAILAHAQTVLDAGDLSATLKVLGTLTGPAAAAMAPWEAQLRSLLEAREALTQMAAG